MKRFFSIVLLLVLTLNLALPVEAALDWSALLKGADLLGGYTLYILPTFLIKGAAAGVAVWTFAKRRPAWITLAGLIMAELVMAGGYFLVEWLVLGYGLAAASGALIPNLVQGLSGVVIVSALLPLMKRIKKR